MESGAGCGPTQRNEMRPKALRCPVESAQARVHRAVAGLWDKPVVAVAP